VGRYQELTTKFLELQRDPDAQREAQKKEEALTEKRLEKLGHGRYKLELMFGPDRRQGQSYVGQLQFFESGAWVSGQGDIKVYLCPGKERKGNGCEAFIPSESNQYDQAYCAACGSVWSSEELYGEIVGKFSTARWADLLEKYFNRFHRNCDIYVKHVTGDLQGATRTEINRQAGGDAIESAKEKVETSMYLLHRIIADSRYTGVNSVFKAFLNG
jgi:hypothetical protein